MLDTHPVRVNRCGSWSGRIGYDAGRPARRADPFRSDASLARRSTPRGERRADIGARCIASIIAVSAAVTRQAEARAGPGRVSKGWLNGP